MRFTFNNAEYSISFSREHKELKGFDPLTGNDITFTSKFPYTTVRIEQLGPDTGKAPRARTIFREATVGAHFTEEFTYEKGRLAALRSVSRTLDKDVKRLVWKAYMGRPRSK